MRGWLFGLVVPALIGISASAYAADSIPPCEAECAVGYAVSVAQCRAPDDFCITYVGCANYPPPSGTIVNALYTTYCEYEARERLNGCLADCLLR